MQIGTKYWLKQSITLETYASVNDYGESSYGTGVSHNARVEYKTRMIRDKGGNQKVSVAQVYLDGSVTITPKDRITLPDTSTPQIIDVQDVIGPDGTSWMKVVFT